MPFIPMTDKNRKEMLDFIGVTDFDGLIEAIPEEARFKGALDLPEPLSEMEVSQLLKELADKNRDTEQNACFLGGGAYDHFIPAIVGHLTSRSEFYTAYTPYQPEVSQGNLQAIYEYQSLIAELTGMDVANASMYDGATAMAESARLMQAQTRRNTILMSKSVHPFYREVVKTYCKRGDITLTELDIENTILNPETLKNQLDDNTAGLLLQHPNFFGSLEETHAIEKLLHDNGSLFAMSVDPVSLGILEAPGNDGADIVTGEGQGLGNALNLGGPYVGIFAVKSPLVRRLPGRLVGVTKDTQGRRGFVLTLQTREQHIRREKATSSICTNEQLCALASTIYLSVIGKKGIRKVADLCLQKAHYLAAGMTELPGFEMMSDRPFFKEFAIRTPIPPKRIIAELKKENILAGIDLARFDYGIEDGLLIAVTEKRSKKEMDRYVELLKKLII